LELGLLVDGNEVFVEYVDDEKRALLRLRHLQSAVELESALLLSPSELYVVDLEPDYEVGLVAAKAQCGGHGGAERAQCIAISSQDVAASVPHLRQAHITAILSVGVDFNFKANADAIGGAYLSLEVYDTPDSATQLKEKLDAAFRFINEHIESKGVENARILIHCNAGYTAFVVVLSSFNVKRSTHFEFFSL
jgi:hypothetical protein